MEYKFVILCLATLATGAKISRTAKNEGSDSDGSESNLLNTIALPSTSTHDDFLDSLGGEYPYEPAHQNYGDFVPPQPTFGVSVNTQALLAPHVEVLRLIEAFIRLKGELLARFQALINDNYELIRSLFNLIISKIGKLHSFSLKGISVVRKILEFALNLFANWSVTLPSLTLGASANSVLQPHATYGVPPSVDTPALF